MCQCAAGMGFRCFIVALVMVRARQSFRFASRVSSYLNNTDLPMNEHNEKMVEVAVGVSLLVRGVVSASPGCDRVALIPTHRLHGLLKFNATRFGISWVLT